MSSAIVKRVVDADLIKLKTSGNFVDGGYSMTSEIEFLGSVGKVLPFDTQ
jgi:hypothetical protein